MGYGFLGIGTLYAFNGVVTQSAAGRPCNLQKCKREIIAYNHNNKHLSPIILSRGYCLPQALELGFFLPKNRLAWCALFGVDQIFWELEHHIFNHALQLFNLCSAHVLQGRNDLFH